MAIIAGYPSYHSANSVRPFEIQVLGLGLHPDVKVGCTFDYHSQPPSTLGVWEGNQRSGVVLVVCRRLCSISIYGRDGLMKEN